MQSRKAIVKPRPVHLPSTAPPAPPCSNAVQSARRRHHLPSTAPPAFPPVRMLQRYRKRCYCLLSEIPNEVDINCDGNRRRLERQRRTRRAGQF